MKKLLSALLILSSSSVMAIPTWQVVEQGMLAAHNYCFAQGYYCGMSFLDQQSVPMGYIRFKRTNPGVIALAANLAGTALALGQDTSNSHKEVLPGGLYNFLYGFNVYGFHLVFQPGGFVEKLKGREPFYFGVANVFYSPDAALKIGAAVKNALLIADKSKKLSPLLEPMKQNIRHSFPMAALAGTVKILKWCDQENLGCSVGVIDAEGDLLTFLRNDKASDLSAKYAIGKSLGAISGVRDTYGSQINHMQTPGAYYRTISQTVNVFIGGKKIRIQGHTIGGVGIGVNVVQGKKFINRFGLEGKLEDKLIQSIKTTLTSVCEYKKHTSS